MCSLSGEWDRLAGGWAPQLASSESQVKSLHSQQQIYQLLIWFRSGGPGDDPPVFGCRLLDRGTTNCTAGCPAQRARAVNGPMGSLL